MRRVRRKKWGVFLVVGLIFLLSFYGRFTLDGFKVNVAHAESEEETIYEEFTSEIEEQLSNLDFGELDGFLDDISASLGDMFSGSFLGKVQSLISGDYVDASSLFGAVFSLVWDNLIDYLPIVAMIIAVSIMGGIIASIKPAMGGEKSVGNIVHFVTYGVIIVILGATLGQIVTKTSSVLTTLSEIMNIIFPILLTLLSAIGGSVSVSLFEPAIAMLGSVFINLITYFLMPLFIFSIVFSIVGNLSNNVKLDKFVSFLNGTFKWVIGLLFTLFLGFMTIQGISASAVDGLSIRTAKYTLKSYVPIVGSYIADGMSVILYSAMLIKNAVGTAGLLLILLISISPIISLIMFMLCLKFMAGIIEPIGDKKIASFIGDMAGSVSMLIALVVAVVFLYTIMTGLIMCSANLL